MKAIPEIERVNRTLDLVSRVLIGHHEFAVVGSFARFVIHGEKAVRPFGANSDLDIAVLSGIAGEAATKIIKELDYGKIEYKASYNGHPNPIPDPPEPPKPTYSGYLLTGESLTQLHISDTYNPEQKPISKTINGIKYLVPS